MARCLHVHGRAPVGRVQVLVREPAGELHVLAGTRAQLLDGVVEPFAREREAHVRQSLRGLHERQLALLHERGVVDRADGQRLALLDRRRLAEGVGHSEVDDAHAGRRDRGVALDLLERVLGVGREPRGPAHDPAARMPAEASLLVAVADVGHVRRVEAADDQNRGLAQQPRQRDRKERVPRGEPAEDHVRAQHAPEHAQRVRHAAGLEQVLDLVALGEDLAVDRDEARLAAVYVKQALLHAASGSRASTKAPCHSDSSSRQ